MVNDLPRDAPQYRIGAAARASGVSAANIRFYELKKLLTAHSRSVSSYRLYSDRDIHALRFIRLCRSMDMSLDEVRSLMGLDLAKSGDCATAAQTLDAHLGHVRERLAELHGLQADLVALRERCDGSGARCHIIEALHELADEKAAAPTRAMAARHV